MKSIYLAATLALAAATPAAAQDRGVSRRLFTFLDNDVTIEVMADIPGTLQVVRGEPGRIDVEGRVPGGMSAFALGGRDGDKLRLTAAGGNHADFIVVVPEDVYLRVRLPNHKVGDLGSTRPGGTFTWDAGATRVATAATLAPPAPPEPVVAHSSDHAPRVLSIPRLTTVRSIDIRTGSSTFDISGNHYMSVVNGNSDYVEVRTGQDIEQLIINVPAGTRDFTLRLGGHTALVVRGGEITTYCEPVTEQSLSGGRWFTFAPEAGRLSCR